MSDPELSSETRDAVAAGLARAGSALIPKPVMPLREYIGKVWGLTEPGKLLVDSWHIGYIAEHLEAVSYGEIRKLIINVIPRSLKSTIVSVDWPTWEWGPLGRPELRYMFVSHGANLSIKHAVSRRTIIESEWYAEEFKRVILSSDQNEKKLVQNTRRGHFLATSTHGAGTGMGGDRLIFDDFIDPESAESDVERNAALQAWELKFSSRLDDPQKGAIVAVEQRLHPLDFTAKLLQEKGWTHISIPSDNFTKTPTTYIFPRSKRTHTVAPGAATFPERKPIEVVMTERLRKGSRTHDAQERQNPQAKGSMIFKPRNWRYYNSLDDILYHEDPKTGARVLTPWDSLLQSWDTTFKDKDSSDFVVGQIWGKRGADRFLLDLIRGQMGITAMMAALVSWSEKWPGAARKLVEDKANGPAVMELLKHKVPGLIAVNPKGGKIVRARAIEPFQEAGNIVLPSPEIAPWIVDFIDECSSFPNGSYDDQVDSMTQANIFLTGNLGPTLSIE